MTAEVVDLVAARARLRPEVGVVELVEAFGLIPQGFAGVCELAAGEVSREAAMNLLAALFGSAAVAAAARQVGGRRRG